MRQLLYISSSTSPAIGDHLSTILVQSRRNNPANGLTGLLWTDGNRFLQVLEGEQVGVQLVFDRILQDTRQRAAVVLHDRRIPERIFAASSVALMDENDERLNRALEHADPVVRGTFQSLIQAAARRPEGIASTMR